jgi:hypothetical protein
MIGAMSRSARTTTACDGIPAAGMPSRRVVVRAVGALAVVGVLGGCRIRLQDDAPDLPFLQRVSIPDEALLVAAYRRAAALGDLAAATAGLPLGPEITTHHRRQATVLLGILTDGGVPGEVLGPTPTATATASRPATSAAPTSAAAVTAVTAADLAGHEASAVTADALTALTGAATRRTLLASVTAYSGAAATLLGSPAPWPTSQPLPPEVAATLLDATRAVTYAAQVAAAQVAGDQRQPVLATLTELARRETALAAVAGAAAHPAPLGYRLPFAVSTPEAASRLLTTAFSALVAGGLATVDSLPPGSRAVGEAVRLHAQAVALGHGWGVALTAFPGMTDG